jgi:hypothetical protein
MLMFSGHIVGQRMCVGRRNGFFYLLLNVVLFLTGMHRHPIYGFEKHAIKRAHHA